MKITSLTQVLLALLLSLIFNVFVVSGFNPGFVGSIFSFLYLIFIPGLFIYQVLKIKNIILIESLGYIIGLSVAYLLFVGLSINSLYFLFGISHPLNQMTSLIVFDVCTHALFLTALFRKKSYSLQLSRLRIAPTHLIFYLLPTIFPILSIFGALLLNNGNSNILTMVLLSSISIYVFLTSLVWNKLKTFKFELPIYLIAISLLFMFSLRSSHVIGWDIFKEYQVFMLTQSHQLWNIDFYRDAYNACLSITILPTLFHYFTNIDNQYIFKVLYQLIFAIVPVIIYSISSKFSNKYISFFSTFFFMSTINFFLEMPALIRQEVAFLFFGLLISTLFNKSLNSLQRRILFVLFSFSIVLSHYSTAYILAGLFGFSTIFLTIYKKFITNRKKMISDGFSLEFLPILVFILFVYIWLGVITKTSTNLSYTFNKTLINISNIGQKTFNTSIIDQLFFYPKIENEQLLLKENISNVAKEYAEYKFTFYPKEAYKDYLPQITHTDNLPSRFSDEVKNAIYFIGNNLTKIIKIFIILGFVSVFFLVRKNRLPFEYGVMSLAFFFGIIGLTSIPVLSLLYPIGRLDQQALFLVGFPTILSLFWILRIFSDRLKMIIISLVFLTYFLYSTTFISQITGDKDPQVFLNNAGRYYSEIYVHDQEIKSIKWLYANKQKYVPIFADLGSSEKIKGYSEEVDINIYTEVFPSVIDKDGYVYSNYANTIYGIGIEDIRVDRMEYNFPTEFLNQNKNLVYNNGVSKVYK